MKLQLLQKGILRYMTSFNVLKNNMEELALTKMLEILPNVIDKSTKNKTSLVDSLLSLQMQRLNFVQKEQKRLILRHHIFRTLKRLRILIFHTSHQ